MRGTESSRARPATACARCGWDCEARGYDDDSNPLPAYQAKYDGFVAELREGRTAAWDGPPPAKKPRKLGLATGIGKSSGESTVLVHPIRD